VARELLSYACRFCLRHDLATIVIIYLNYLSWLRSMAVAARRKKVCRSRGW
jgi:hypothetical protein